MAVDVLPSSNKPSMHQDPLFYPSHSCLYLGRGRTSAIYRALLQQTPVFKQILVMIFFSESYIIARGGRLLHAGAQSYSGSASTP